MKYQCQILGLGLCWSHFVSNVDSQQAPTGLTPLGEILAARPTSVSGHIARLRVMFLSAWRSAGTLSCRLVVLLVPTGDDAPLDLALDG